MGIKHLFTCLLAMASFAYGNQVSESQQKWIKHYAKQTKIIAPEAALINDETEPDLSEGFDNLYNGKNLDGWVLRGGKQLVETSGEAIIGRCVEGEPSAYLSTVREDYTDFIFSAEVKWEVNGNSGIMFRAQRKPGHKVETVFGPQCEMEGHGNDRGWSGGIYGQGIQGWRYPLWLDAHEAVRKAIKKGKWNRVTIQAVGKHVKTWINGLPAAHWETEEYVQGFFGLQIHSGKRGTIHFRNLKVKELLETGEDLFANNDFSKWICVRGKPVGKGWSIDETGVITRSGLFPGDIITKQHYKDFDLSFEWKISSGGNSGVKYRTKGSLGVEYQILDDTKHRNGKNPLTQAAAMYDLFPTIEDKPIQPVGEWNRGRIVVQGNQIEHWLNDVKVLEVEIGSVAWKTQFGKSKYKKHAGFGTWSGPILLQDHRDLVWYRNVRIQEL